MYNISDLSAMSEVELKGIAENMGLKKVDVSDKDGLMYRILDQQAIDMAASATEKKRRGSQEPKPKRGRPAKKDKEKATEASEQPAVENKQTNRRPIRWLRFRRHRNAVAASLSKFRRRSRK